MKNSEQITGKKKNKNKTEDEFYKHAHRFLLVSVIIA